MYCLSFTFFCFLLKEASSGPAERECVGLRSTLAVNQNHVATNNDWLHGLVGLCVVIGRLISRQNSLRHKAGNK